jgi:prophage antirepressor-like protein
MAWTGKIALGKDARQAEGSVGLSAARPEQRASTKEKLMQADTEQSGYNKAIDYREKQREHILVFADSRYGKIRILEKQGGHHRFVDRDIAAALGYAGDSRRIFRDVPNRYKRLQVLPAETVSSLTLTRQGLNFFLQFSGMKNAVDFAQWIEVRLALALTGRHSPSGSAAPTGTTPSSTATTPAGHITDFAENSAKENNVEIPTNENSMFGNVDPQTQPAETAVVVAGHADERNTDTQTEQAAFAQFDSPEFGRVRTVPGPDGETWFIASDIAKALGYENSSEAVRSYCIKINKISQASKTLGGPPTLFNIIPESDVHRLTVRTRLPNAERFRAWLVSEIFPAVRRRDSDMPPAAEEKLQPEKIEPQAPNVGVEFNVAGNAGTPSDDTSAGTSALTQFESPEFGQIRVRLNQNGDPWFVAKDLCRVLEIEKYRDAVARLDEDERGSELVDTLGGRQEMSTVSESGLYSLIFRSRKPEARRFRKWVTSEVLPAIRKRGVYVAPTKSGELSFGPSTLRRLAAEWEKDRQERTEAEDMCWNQCMARIDATERADAESVARRASDQRANAALQRVAHLEARIQLLQEGKDGHLPLTDPVEVRLAKTRKFRVWKNEGITIRELAKRIKANVNCRVGIRNFYQFLRSNGY